MPSATKGVQRTSHPLQPVASLAVDSSSRHSSFPRSSHNSGFFSAVVSLARFFVVVIGPPPPTLSANDAGETPSGSERLGAGLGALPEPDERLGRAEQRLQVLIGHAVAPGILDVLGEKA